MQCRARLLSALESAQMLFRFWHEGLTTRLNETYHRADTIWGTLYPLKHATLMGSQRLELIRLLRKLQVSGEDSIALMDGLPKVQSLLETLSPHCFTKFHALSSQRGSKRRDNREELGLPAPPMLKKQRVTGHARAKTEWYHCIPYHLLYYTVSKLGPEGFLKMGKDWCNDLLGVLGKALQMEKTASGGGKRYKLKDDMMGEAGSAQKSARALCYLLKQGSRGENVHKDGHYTNDTIDAFDLPASLLQDGDAFTAMTDFFELDEELEDS